MRRYRLIFPIFSGFVFISVVKLTEKWRGRCKFRRGARENEPSRGKWQMSSAVVFGDLQTPRGPSSNSRGTRFFSYFLWNVRHAYFQCKPVSLPGPDRAGMLDPSETCPAHVHLWAFGYTCKPRRPGLTCPALLHVAAS